MAYADQISRYRLARQAMQGGHVACVHNDDPVHFHSNILIIAMSAIHSTFVRVGTYNVPTTSQNNDNMGLKL